ncbi:hypothetical protein DYB25_010692 [Aphanomyces astaci]|uniref:Uncharacterized protein n=2 Tax=Aphanomyces astaci TaxID=112090 RepID=A0A397AJY7_APHAT|nr:hypothetical protein DYB25_010692 [Aphanomyces astaci]
MLSDRILVETTNDQVVVTLRAYSTPFRVGTLITAGTAATFGVLCICLTPTTLFILGVCAAFIASTAVFVGVQWLVYGFEQFTVAASTLTYEWGIPGTGLWGATAFNADIMGPIQIHADGALGFTYQGQVVRVGKVLRAREKLEFLDLLLLHLPARLVSVPPVAMGDVYYPVDGKLPAAPSSSVVPSQSHPPLAPIRVTATPAEAHI